MKILFVVNEAKFFISHRLMIGLVALERGYDVAVVSAPNTGEEQLAQYGFRHISVPMSRSGLDIIEELRTYKALRKLYLQEQPDLVHHITIKPVIYGSFAARRSSVHAVVNAVPGMGFIFTRLGTLAAVRRACVNVLYRMAFAHPRMRVIFQNTEDLRGFIGHAIVTRENAVLIRGSGVDLSLFPSRQEPPEPIKFVLAARMLRHKGVNEFASAAAIVRQKHPDWEFVLAGDVDVGNPASLTEAQLRDLESSYGVTWVGHCNDIPALLAESHIACLPTYYREGLPKSLLEASAAGLPMIASNIAGCREVVTDEVNGLIVEPRQIEPLAEAMLRLGEDKALREKFGRAAREKAHAVFSVDDVVDHTFRVYDEVLNA